MDMRHLLEQAKNLEKALKDTDARLQNHITEAQAGDEGRSVSVRVNGAGDVLEVQVSPGLVQTGDVGLIERTLVAALSSATATSRAYREEQRAALTGGLKLPEF